MTDDRTAIASTLPRAGAEPAAGRTLVLKLEHRSYLNDYRWQRRPIRISSRAGRSVFGDFQFRFELIMCLTACSFQSGSVSGSLFGGFLTGTNVGQPVKLANAALGRLWFC
jgi:hypothetical protein